MKKALVSGVIAGLLLAGCKSAPGGGDDNAAVNALVQVSVATVATSDVSDDLQVTGAIAPQPDHEAKIAPQTAGRVASVLVHTGSYVRRGETVATLAPGTTPGQLQQAEAAVRLARETLAQTRLNLTSQIQSQRSAVTQAQLALQVQQVALAKLRAGSRPQEIVQASANLSAAQASLTAARQGLTRAQTLFSEGLIAKKDLEAAQQLERTAAAGVVTAQQALSLAKQGNRPEDIRAGQVAVSQAAEAVRTAKQGVVLNRSKWQDVQIAKAQVASAEGALNTMRAQAHYLTVASPLSGFVVGRPVNVGENVDFTSVIATVVDLSTARLLLNVPADKVSRVRVGQTVRFFTDSDPIHAHEAVIHTVGQVVDPATNAVQVVAISQNSDKSLRDDGFVKATIVLRSRQGVATVPIAALVNKDGKSIVFVVGADNEVKAHPVELGIRTVDRVEVLSGVKVGDKVVTTGAYELDDGMAVKVGS